MAKPVDAQCLGVTDTDRLAGANSVAAGDTFVGNGFEGLSVAMLETLGSVFVFDGVVTPLSLAVPLNLDEHIPSGFEEQLAAAFDPRVRSHRDFLRSARTISHRVGRVVKSIGTKLARFLRR
ncbi:hypothetical protein QCA50_002557 [Cerrena zonata]|uniref:Uncharacterized protein n=1 Tax=Cerrena zonata TaxID=2478898 RepID=A0AAW0GRA8_9APHY